MGFMQLGFVLGPRISIAYKHWGRRSFQTSKMGIWYEHFRNKSFSKSKSSSYLFDVGHTSKSTISLTRTVVKNISCFLSFFYFCKYVYILICKYVCAHECLWRPEFRHLLSTLVFETESLTEPGSHWWAKLSSPQDLGILSLFPGLRLYACAAMLGFWCGFCGSELRPTHLNSKHVTHRATSSASALHLK